jgi:hypothetical protein
MVGASEMKGKKRRSNEREFGIVYMEAGTIDG